MRSLLLAIFVVLSAGIFAQNSVTFYKTKELKKEVKEKNANYRYTVVIEGEILKKEVYNLNNKCVVSVQKFDKDNHATGVWLTRNDDCGETVETNFETLHYASHQNTKKTTSLVSSNDTDTLEFPSFGKGMDDLMRYLYTNIKRPKETYSGETTGIVYLTFVIMEDGSINDVLVLKGVDPFLDLEASRVVAAMPNWNPGKKNGVAVSVQYNLPVQFR